MKTWKRRLASISALHFFVVSFAISVPVSNRLALYAIAQMVATNGKSEGKTGFTLIRMANGVTKDGGSFSENIYQAHDGQKVYEYIIHTGSTDKVKKDFDARLKDATKVIEQVQPLEEKGQVVGQRAVITGPDKQQKTTSMILITAGNNLRIIQSESLEDALEFETQAKEGHSDSGH
jgi:hypothetical protein